MQKVASGFKAHAELFKSLFYQWQREAAPIHLKFLRSRFFWIGVCCACALILYLNVDLAHAQVFKVFDDIQKDAERQALGGPAGGGGWILQITRLAHTTFVILAVLEICWAAAIWALEKDNLNSLAVEMIQKIMFIGFFYTLLQYAPTWIPTITQTFRSVGENAVGRPITPATTMQLGMDLIDKIWVGGPSGLGVIFKLGEVIVAVFVTIAVVVCHVIIALQLLALNIESYILLAAGAFLLALGSSRWTSEYVSKYLQYALTVGMRLLVLLLILGITRSVLENNPVTGFTYNSHLKVFGIVLMQTILAIKAPEMGSALMSGGIGFSAGSATSAVNSMISTATTAASAAKAGMNKGAGQAAGKGLGQGAGQQKPGMQNAAAQHMGRNQGGAGMKGPGGTGPAGNILNMGGAPSGAPSMGSNSSIGSSSRGSVSSSASSTGESPSAYSSTQGSGDESTPLSAAVSSSTSLDAASLSSQAPTSAITNSSSLASHSPTTAESSAARSPVTAAPSATNSPNSSSNTSASRPAAPSPSPSRPPSNLRAGTDPRILRNKPSNQ